MTKIVQVETEDYERWARLTQIGHLAATGDLCIDEKAVAVMTQAEHQQLERDVTAEIMKFGAVVVKERNPYSIRIEYPQKSHTQYVAPGATPYGVMTPTHHEHVHASMNEGQLPLPGDWGSPPPSDDFSSADKDILVDPETMSTDELMELICDYMDSYQYAERFISWRRGFSTYGKVNHQPRPNEGLDYFNYGWNVARVLRDRLEAGAYIRADMP